MGKKDPLDPGLRAILDSIRQTVGGEAPPPKVDEDGPVVAPPPARTPETRTPDSRTVEEFFADLIRPQVQAWLDANLAEIVQKLAAEEIRRLTGQR
jgi:hypothetical protein